MKKQVVILAVSLLLSAATVFGQTLKPNDGGILTKEAIDNYMAGINSGNDGVRISSAYFLGEYKVEEAIIPLMKMLSNEKTDEGRIIAALSLTKIGTGKAVYAVKQAAKFDDSQRVRDLCARFYNSYALSAESGSEL